MKCSVNIRDYEGGSKAEPINKAEPKTQPDTIRETLHLSAGSLLPKHCWDGRGVLSRDPERATYVV